MGAFTIRVQAETFDAGAEMQALTGDPACGAVVSFVGLVRDYGDNADIAALELEHYPGMTESALQTLLDDARQRWPLGGATIIHRIGRLALGEPIVLVFPGAVPVASYPCTDTAKFNGCRSPTAPKWITGSPSSFTQCA